MKAAVVLPKRLIYQSDLASVPENRTTYIHINAIPYIFVCIDSVLHSVEALSSGAYVRTYIFMYVCMYIHVQCELIVKDACTLTIPHTLGRIG